MGKTLGMSELLNVLGKSKHYEVLKSLKECGLKQQEIQIKAKTYLSVVQRALESFKKLGLVLSYEVENSNTKRKVTKYELTPQGKAVLEKLEELEELLKAIAETPTEEEKKELVEKALSGKLRYDKEVAVGRDREV